jgi:glycosyltransferase involved in cell wall biosynthesis
VKVLLSAIACHPDLGSEAKVGWDAVCAISAIPIVSECHVMTHGASEQAIMRAQKDGKANNVRFHFFGEPFQYHRSRMLARLQSWLLYRDWQMKSLARGMRLHQEYGFSLTHHVTYASWRVVPKLWYMPIPFILGPVGGGGTTPPAFRSMLGPSARTFEFLRDTTTSFSTQSKDLKLCCAHSAAVLAADTVTAHFLALNGASHVRQLCQVFFTQRQASRFNNTAHVEHARDAGLSIFAGGNLEGRKGTTLSLKALSLLKNMGIPFSYTYGGWGPQLNAMKSLAKQLGIAQQVHFHEGFVGVEYVKRLLASDIYLLPSVRETAGITMMEAMMAGCFPIVLAGTGAGDIVERSGGAAIQADSPNEAVDKIAAQLKWCFVNRRGMRQQAKAAGNNIRSLFSEEHYQGRIAEIYTEVVAKHICGPKRI